MVSASDQGSAEECAFGLTGIVVKSRIEEPACATEGEPEMFGASVCKPQCSVLGVECPLGCWNVNDQPADTQQASPAAEENH
jgi:hypothetical protein